MTLKKAVWEVAGSIIPAVYVTTFWSWTSCLHSHVCPVH